MDRLQRAMIVSLSVIAPQNNVRYFVTGCQVKSSITMRHCWQCYRGSYLVLHDGRLAARKETCRSLATVSPVPMRTELK